MSIEQRGGMHEDQEVMRFGPTGEKSPLYARSYINGCAQRKPLSKRMLALGGNELVQPLPRLGLPDPVGSDIKDIPTVLRRIKDDWVCAIPHLALILYPTRVPAPNPNLGLNPNPQP